MNRGPPKPMCTSITAEVVVPGCCIINNFITETEEMQLLFSDEFVETSVKWIGKELDRRQQHYGFEFNYYTKMIDYLSEVDEMPYLCNEISNRIFGHLKESNIVSKKLLRFNQLTVNEYNAGQGKVSYGVVFKFIRYRFTY